MILGSSAGNVTTVAKMTRPRLFAESVNRFRVYSFSLPTSYPRSARLCLVEVEPVMSYQTIRRISSAVTTVTGKVRVRQMRNTQDRQREGEKQRERGKEIDLRAHRQVVVVALFRHRTSGFNAARCDAENRMGRS
ncbi:hypothetical protein ALC53_07131 [Atta colombica]|uniref:Uncharacterized protein n=1 Tax=Atta colombica TaxID=520822 RepID=A0A195BCQ9_9HYME|nr:hypothetical protein ALC53_07131 [Atta colombica]